MNGSDGNEAACRFAAQLARETGAAVLAVHVREFLTAAAPVAAAPMAGGVAAEFQDEHVKAAEAAAREKAAVHLNDSAITWEFRVADGEPADTLRRIGDDVDADLVVVGTRGLGVVGRAVMGSVSSRLVHHATLPVVVVPEPEQE